LGQLAWNIASDYSGRELPAVVARAVSNKDSEMTRRKYATAWWTVKDVSDGAKEAEVKLTRGEARLLLASIEKTLEEMMVGAGWTVIQNALAERAYLKDRRVA